MSVWPSETILVPPHPAVIFTQSDRPCTHPEPPPLPTAMVRAHSHRCLCGALARERRRRRRGTNAECRTPRRRDARVTSNNARAHVAARRHDRDRGHDTDHDRDRCGPPRRRASCTSCDAAPSLAMAVEVPAVTRRVKRAARHAHLASRACMRTSSPRIARIVTVSVPPAHDRHARATAALARSIDRARGVALAMAVKEAVGYTARHMRHEKSASLAHTSTPSTRIARVITDFRSPRARASCGGGGARSSLDRAHAVWRRRWRWR